ncbi:glucose-1-phosphatase [Pantoea sp. NPDC088449]|uniref:Putative hydrolase of the HAD superfamily n=1 Tax=Candidatus Pantoea floridensis TaxID=1938870 RepID=A0A286BTJ8_9GAMM|nr:glucose-1-phosphatase [Pantoea floridensis]PIF24049.1 putative hydrolase of the HAD superfamily [Enterobacteriaceae bacterium JKS000233]SOD37502.1 putative hydrolase of the HAD superfamily [Pantoea floridensis]HBZ16847.1 glucose-1-phosphatase [Pantoea sp.]
MLYIFDLGNVIVDIDFNRVLGVWSDLGRVPLATLQSRFRMDEAFEKHERGEISDPEFAARICDQLDIALSYPQFTAGWQAVFVGVRPETLAIMNKLRANGERVVILSNTNQLHFEFWPTHYPDVQQAADHLYMSQDIGMRKPEARIYNYVLQHEGYQADQAVFFDDNQANIDAARALGIESVLVVDEKTVPDWFAGRL